MILLLQYTIIFAAVLTLVAIGGCFSEHSGVINIGLEGIMVMGALGGALVMRFSNYPASGSAFTLILLTMLAAVVFGMIYSLLLAVACINFKADQTIVGTAMNMLGTAAATVIDKAMNTRINPDNVSSTIQYINQKKVEKAQLLLITDNMTVKEIAYSLGFNDHSYFIRFFKKVTGLTPNQYRDEMK